MIVSLQLAYSTENRTTFSYEYHMKNHMELIGTVMWLHGENIQVTEGLSGAQDTPAPFYAVATILYKDQGVLEASLALVGQEFEDVRNYYDGQPTVIIGEVVD